MTVNLTANAVNVTFNYILIWGKFGFPRWGVFGAGVANDLLKGCGSRMVCDHCLRQEEYASISRAVTGQTLRSSRES